MGLSDPKAIVEEYRQRRFRQRLIVLPVALVAIEALRMRAHATAAEPWKILVAAVVAIGAFLYTLSNWRCPACDLWLAKRTNPATCPRCGAKFHE